MDVNYEYIDPFDEKYHYLMRVEHLGRYYLATNLLKNYQNVLDVACANGYGTYILSKYVNIVYGIDRNKEYLELAKEKYNANNIVYKQLDLNSQKIEGTYDGIVCFETLEHLKYPESFIKDLYNLLDNDGILLLSIPNSIYEKFENGKNKDSYHLHVFEYNDIIDLIKKVGFKIKKIYGQSYINKIVNGDIKEYKLSNVIDDAKNIAYPNEEDINKTYSYIFILNKR